MREAPGVKQRRGDQRALAGAQRDLLDQAGDRVQRRGLLAVGALRRAGRAAREDHDPALRRGHDDVARVAALDQRLEQVGAVGRRRAVRPGDEAAATLRRGLDQALELLVVDDRPGLLALADLGELRRRERGVEKQGVRAELRAGDHRLDEAAVVAAQQRDVVALDDPLVAPRVRERVRAPVDLGERQRACLVDDRDVVGVADRRRGVAGGRRRTPVLDRLDRAHELVGPRRAEHAALDQGAHGAGLRRQGVEEHARESTEGAARPAPRRTRSAGGCRPHGAS